MRFDFYLSYSRADYDVFSGKFFEDLSNAVRDFRGLPESANVGFFDKNNSAELAEEWDSATVEALQSSSVFVALTSPAYFTSEYCGKEWALFERKLVTPTLDGPVLPLIKPIVWIPVDTAAVSPGIRYLLMTFGDPQGVQNQRGLKYLLKTLRNQDRQMFNGVVEALAREIIEAAARHHAQPLTQVPRLQDVPSAFPITTPTSASADVPSAFPITTPTSASADVPSAFPITTPTSASAAPSAIRRDPYHPTVFLCYRREDTADATGRLHDRLVKAYGSKRVYMDIDSVPLGVDFIDHVANQISGCSVVIVMIGKQWLKVKDKRRRRRLGNHDDPVRAEIAAALQQEVPVIPVLVQGAEMPLAEELPDSIRTLARRNGIELSATRWQVDVDRLIKSLDLVIGR